MFVRVVLVDFDEIEQCLVLKDVNLVMIGYMLQSSN